MILVRDIHLQPGESLGTVPAKAAKKLRLPENKILSCEIVRRSLDARKKNDIHYSINASVSLEEKEEERILASSDAAKVCRYEPPKMPVFEPVTTAVQRPVVVGFGMNSSFSKLIFLFLSQ